MRRLIFILAVAACVTGLAASPSSAARLASDRDATTTATCTPCTGYLQDGNGQGDAASLKPGVRDDINEELFAEPAGGGAWRWDQYDIESVPDGLFTYTPLENATQANNDHVFIFALHANSNFCMVNSGGSAWSQDCTSGPGARGFWVYDKPTGYLINVGRSNDQGNWEILCNPGGGSQLTITTRDNCSDYHKEWAFNIG